MSSHWLKDFDFEFPEELVAQRPLEDRSASRMMVLGTKDQKIQHDRFRNLPGFLNPGDLIVVNDTSVFPSRLFARKKTGGVLEVFLLRRVEGTRWQVLLSPTRGLREGEAVRLFSRDFPEGMGPLLTVTSLQPEDFQIQFESEAQEREAMARFGEMPLPPYIKRPHPQPADRERYQTLFAKHTGAVAAPTAGLHFTPAVREELSQRGVAWASVTLHVGLGTFAPVRSERLEDHVMHEEYFEIPESTREAVGACRDRGGKILAVGTTTLRALETFAVTHRLRGWTDLFILPGFQPRIVDHLLTNFHQPRSTLLVLVSALAGPEFILKAYAEAIRREYRLFSYGDCMLIQRGPETL